MSVADTDTGSLSCLEALSGDEEHRDPPRVAHEKATFTLLRGDACCQDPLFQALRKFTPSGCWIASCVGLGDRAAVGASGFAREFVG